MKNVDMEDEVSIEAHVRLMNNEMKKKRKDLFLIDDRMRRTYRHRRLEVQEGRLTIVELLEKYPALTESTCVSFFYFLSGVLYTYLWLCSRDCALFRRIVIIIIIVQF